MHDDDLHRPLRPRSRLQRLWDRRPTPAQAAWALVLAALLGAGVFSFLAPGPGARPGVSVAIRDADPAPTASTGRIAGQAPAAGEAARAEGERPPREERTAEPDMADDVDPSVPSAGSLPRTPQEARRKQVAMLGLVADTPLPRAPARGLSERSPFGPLPRVSRSGRKPWQAYAKPVPKKILLSPRPKVAIVIGGLGLNRELTQRAVNELPGVVTLAYAPYGKGLQRQIDAARRAGHEVMLQVPMEPWGYPAISPGPRTLLVSAGVGAVRTNLRWFMARATGYTGLVSYAGQRFLSEGTALSPVLHEVKRRGLIFLDDSGSEKSLLPSLAAVIGMPAVRTDLRIDAERDPLAIQAALTRLEQEARRKGFAIGSGSAFPETIAALREWLASLKGARDGAVVVPLSAVIRLKQER